MATLTALSASHGFTAGDLDTSGYVAMIPAFQKVYFADGRTYSATIGDSGYHKLDFINTKISTTIEPTDWVQGDTVSSASSEGIFDEYLDNGDSTYEVFIYRTVTTEFADDENITNTDKTTITGASISAVTAPPHWLNWTLTDGDFPDGGSNIGCLCFGRIFLNSMLNPHQWYCSRVFDPLDFDSSQTDVAAATYSQNSKAGEVGDPIVAMIPYKDIYLIWGCANQIWTLTSDPLMGGVNRCLSKSTGIFSPTSYCWDDKNNLYFLGTDGIYGLSAEAIANSSPPENLTKQRNPKLISSLGLNRRTDRVAMGFDKKRYGIKVSVTQQDGQWAVPWWFDLRTTGGLFPEKYASGQEAASLFYYDSYKSSERGLLIGGYDGYIRKEDEDEKSDDGSNAIESHFSIGPITADGEPRGEVGINEASIVAGEDTDGVTVEYYRADSADEVVSNVLNEETALISNTLTGDGLNNSIINRVSARAVVVKVKNETADESFSIEQINLSLQSEGRKDK
jgi:hypothetical protein